MTRTPVAPDEAALAATANTIRQQVSRMLLAAGSGHTASALGMADVFTTLYFEVLDIDPADPWRSDRDRVVLSDGQICPIWYATLAERGYFDIAELDTLRQVGDRLRGHPQVRSLPGIEASSGPRGQGLSQGIGMALAAQSDGASWRTHVLLTDGEHAEGRLWEAVLFAARCRLHTLTAWVERDNAQVDGPSGQITPFESLAARYAAYGWHVLEIDGHDHRAIADAAGLARAIHERPTVVICHTVSAVAGRPGSR